jgi:hypothetical protein
VVRLGGVCDYSRRYMLLQIYVFVFGYYAKVIYKTDIYLQGYAFNLYQIKLKIFL